MKESTIKVNMETNGFDEAEEKIKSIADAFGSFPANVVFKNCKDCHFEIYPSQIMIVSEKEKKNPDRGGSDDYYTDVQPDEAE